MIRIRTIEKSPDGRISPADYRVVRSFWTGRGLTPPDREMLPTLGVVAEIHSPAPSGAAGDGGEPGGDGGAASPPVPVPAACGFLYLDATGSGVAWLSWTATDSSLPAATAGRGLRHVLDFLEAEAAALGYWLVTATLADPGFITLMRRRGYGRGDTGLSHLFKCQDAGTPAS